MPLASSTANIDALPPQAHARNMTKKPPAKKSSTTSATGEPRVGGGILYGWNERPDYLPEGFSFAIIGGASSRPPPKPKKKRKAKPEE